MNETPKGNRTHIALVGRTNVGKSSLLNLISGQDVAITSNVPGTTTDVVEKTMELLPLGPVVFLDTAGLDDKTDLAELRRKKTSQALKRADAVILVAEAGVWTEYEERIVQETEMAMIPLVIAVNKIDLGSPDPNYLAIIGEKTPRLLSVAATNDKGREACLRELKRHLAASMSGEAADSPSLLGDLLPPGGLAGLVTPIDLQAPKGRLILPQVQTIRAALDIDAAALIIKERELSHLLGQLKESPRLVVCDSQAVLKVTAGVPREIPCTTFSILFARQKGDLNVAAAGAAAINSLRPGDQVLIAEACSHHPLADDIGRVKIPRWLRQYVGGEIQTEITAGKDYPRDLRPYRLIVHCGACMFTRREMLRRLKEAREQQVPITNYGLAISVTQGVIERTLQPFPAALAAYERELAAPASNINGMRAQ